MLKHKGKSKEIQNKKHTRKGTKMNDSQASAETRVGTVVGGVWKLLMGPHRGMPLSRAFTVTVTMIPGTLKKKKKSSSQIPDFFVCFFTRF